MIRAKGKKRKRVRTGGDEQEKREQREDKVKIITMKKGQKKGRWRGKRRYKGDNETHEAQFLMSADDRKDT